MEVRVLMSRNDQPVINFEIVSQKELDKYAVKPLKPMLSDGLCEESKYNYYLAVKNLKEKHYLAVRKEDR